MNLTNTTIITLGQDAHAVVVSGEGSQTNLGDGNALNTAGDGAVGLYATGGGVVTATGGTLTVSTTGTDSETNGLGAYGVFAEGSGSQIGLVGATITTAGDGAIGIYATAGGVVTAAGPITISTSGTNSEFTGFSAFGVYAEGSGSQVDLAGATITTAGRGAVGLYATTGVIEEGSFRERVRLRPDDQCFRPALGHHRDGAVRLWRLGARLRLDDRAQWPEHLHHQRRRLRALRDRGRLDNGRGLAGDRRERRRRGRRRGRWPRQFGDSERRNDDRLERQRGRGPVRRGGRLHIGSRTGHDQRFGREFRRRRSLLERHRRLWPAQHHDHSDLEPGVRAHGRLSDHRRHGRRNRLHCRKGDRIRSMRPTPSPPLTISPSPTQSGDLILADPSSATINFNGSSVNAGLNNLLDATAGSIVTLNASASALTGVISTDATSTSNVNLTNGSIWNMTGPSTVSTLSVFNSAVVFAPPGAGGAFKTLTVGAYVGSGANVTLNAFLSGANSNSDRIIVNGGTATGSTLLTIHNVGGLGGQTTGAGIPVVLATNGGSIASDAFALANVPVVGGFRYTLDQSDQAYFLVSSPTSTISDIANSINNLARSQQSQIISNRILTSILLGATEQINCSDCSSGFGAIGSFALGAHGRWSLSDRLTVMGGFSYNQYSANGVSVDNAPMFAGSLVYDLVDWGRSRPFFEFGGGVTPYSQVHYNRYYPNGLTTGLGSASAINRNAAVFGRVGWVDRLTPIDEAAVYGDLSRNWMQTGGFTEGSGPLNPFPATVENGVDTLDVARIGAQYTHLFAGNFEVNVSAAYAYGFGAGFGSQVNVLDFGTVAPYPIENSGWVEYGARIGYRVSHRMVIDAFMVGTLGGQPAGNTIHGGLGLRYLF